MMNCKIPAAAAALGSVVGAFVANDQAAVVQSVWVCMGCVAGAAIGGADAYVIGRMTGRGDAGRGRNAAQHSRQFDPRDGLTRSQRDLNDNYWIEHGRLTANPGVPNADDPDDQG